MTIVRHRSSFHCGVDQLFAFHADLANLERISPPFFRVRLISDPDPAPPAGVSVFEFALGPVTTEWHARIAHQIEPRLVEDVQEKGPFRKWRHQHRIRPAPDGASLEDVISFRLIPTPAGEFIEWLVLRPLIKLVLMYRHRRTRALVPAVDAPSRAFLG